MHLGCLVAVSCLYPLDARSSIPLSTQLGQRLQTSPAVKSSLAENHQGKHRFEFQVEGYGSELEHIS